MKMTQSPMALEIAAHSLQSALQAELGGADRIELCQALPTGGLTPGIGTMQLVRDRISIPVHVLIRPRLGNFEYTHEEIEVMCQTIDYCKRLGMDGVVIGCLKGDKVDEGAFKTLLEASKGLDVTFHRAFDLVSTPMDLTRQLITWKINRILTSGQAKSAWAGRSLLATLQADFGNKIDIMPGAGISKDNIGELQSWTRCRSFHSSAKRSFADKAILDKLGITSVGGLHLPKYETDAHEVRLMKQILSKMSDA